MIIFYPEQSTWLSSLPMKLRMANFPLLKLQGTWDQTGFYKPELTLINQFSYDLLRNISWVMENSKFTIFFMHVLNKCAKMLTALYTVSSYPPFFNFLLSELCIRIKNTLIEFKNLIFHPSRSIFKCLPHFDYPLKRG